MKKLGNFGDYEFSEPCLEAPRVPIKSHKAVTDILKNQRSFKVPCEYCQPALIF